MENEDGEQAGTQPQEVSAMENEDGEQAGTQPQEDEPNVEISSRRKHSMLHGSYGVLPVNTSTEGYKYDSFMVYATEDRTWVKELVEKLEESKGYKVCLECRDFKAGRPFSENFQESVECSRKIVIVLSLAFVQSDWCDMVCQFAASHVNKIIPIKREECRWPQILGNLDFIDMTCDVALEYFWKKLVKSLEFENDKPGVKKRTNGDDCAPVTYNVNINKVSEGGNVAVGQGACFTNVQKRDKEPVNVNQDDLVVDPEAAAVPPRSPKETKDMTSNGRDRGNQYDSTDLQYVNEGPNEKTNHTTGSATRPISHQVKNCSLPRNERVFFSDEKYINTENGNYLPHYQNATQQPKRNGRWEPQPLSGVLQYDFAGCKETELDSFQNDVDGYLERFARMTGDKRETAEQFILQIVLPGLEKSNQKKGFRDLESYWVLAKLSCCKNSPATVKHSLSQLLTLLSRDKENDYSDHCKTRIRKVEKIIRLSLISPHAIYNEEGPTQHRQRLTVYSRLISLFNIYFAQGNLLLFNEDDFNELQSVIKRLENISTHHLIYKKKDRLRYSVEFIIEGIKRLLGLKKDSEKLDAILKKCEAALNGDGDIKDVDFQRMFGEGKTDWFTAHVTLIYLHTRTYDNDKAINLIWNVVRAKQSITKASWRTGAKIDWRFSLITATLLTDICMNHRMKDTRVIAGSIMADYLKSEEMKKSSEARAIIERHTKRALLCPDESTIKILAYQLFSNKDAQTAEVSCETLLKFLCWSYRHQSLETCETISNGTWNLLKRGFFRGKEVVVKVLKVRTQDIFHDNEATQEVRSRLITEVYAIRKLNENPHPNIVRVFGYNTESRPYHVITEYISCGNLLRFLRDSRIQKPLPPFHILLQMCGNIIDGLIYLYSRNLIHIRLMAENILVGEDLACKIGGLHSVRQVKPSRTSESEYSYSTSNFPVLELKNESLPARWTAPEALNLGWFSIASEVWSLGVTMYEIFTYGCVPYLRVNIDEEGMTSLVRDQDVKAYVQQGKQLPNEACFEDGIYNIICHCCCKNQYLRPLELAVLKSQVQQLYEKLYAENTDEKPRPNPPTLDVIKETEEVLEYSDTAYATIDEIKDKIEIYADGRFAIARNKSISSVVHKDSPYASVEWVEDLNLSHLRRLVYLDNPNTVRLLAVNPCGSQVEVISEPATHGNLKDYIVNNNCTEAERLLFLTQIATGMNFLHCNHIVHGQLRAENVDIVIKNGFQVKVARLGRSKPLLMSPYEVNSISCVAESVMSPDSVRWSSPEVIQSGHFTHAADVWSFGVLTWELYTAATADQPITVDDLLPYKEFEDDEVLGYLQDDNRLSKPTLCSDWIYILIKQCWLYWRRERPPFIALIDCLTSSNPWHSWMMRLWLMRHESEVTNEWPDRKVTQPENARHILKPEEHPTEETLRRMCSEEFLAEHTYHYVPSSIRLRERCTEECEDPRYDKPYDDMPSQQSHLSIKPSAEANGSQTKETETLIATKPTITPCEDNETIYEYSMEEKILGPAVPSDENDQRLEFDASFEGKVGVTFCNEAINATEQTAKTDNGEAIAKYNHLEEQVSSSSIDVSSNSSEQQPSSKCNQEKSFQTDFSSQLKSHTSVKYDVPNLHCCSMENPMYLTAEGLTENGTKVDLVTNDVNVSKGDSPNSPENEGTKKKSTRRNSGSNNTPDDAASKIENSSFNHASCGFCNGISCNSINEHEKEIFV